MTTITVEPVRDDLHFGARIGGVTHERLADAGVRTAINDHFEEFGLLIFEGVDPTPAMQVAISTVIGPLKDHPSQAVHRAGGDDMLGVIEMRHEPNAPGKIEIDGRELSSWLPWHFDHCYNDQLNRAGVLRCVEGPNDGGLTGFVDGIALYQAISPAARARIEGETVIYAMDVIMGNLRYGRPDDLVEVEPAAQSTDVMAEFAGRPRALHPAVWTRRTGEKVLHVSPWMAKGVEGREPADADALLMDICDEIVEAARGLGYFHRWQPTDMLAWDNWRCLHSVSGMDPEHVRCMHRTTIEGDYGLGRFEAPPSAN
ncbi:MAG TPA: TauD/TfdA family dioxygenase [Acidimicrobiia bacterium]|jgi:taurine dioxygenase|nr:TauD/TfdA family dioxygenase [Acidimicrobiia bacterium]